MSRPGVGDVMHPQVEREACAENLERRFQAMGGPVHLWAVEPGPSADEALDAAEAVMREVHRACTRFDAHSPLMQANAAGDLWCAVPPVCLEALAEAHRAHLVTAGRFDPRVLAILNGWGYRTSMDFDSGTVRTERTRATTLPRGRWAPGIDRTRGVVRIGRHPVDFGGIGKGLALRWAAERLRGHSRAALLEAGGDIALLGAGPDGTGWLVGVEDPCGGPEPIAVLRLTQTACATSSTRLRRWRAGDGEVHHLVDPSTGRPGGCGLRAVTVVHPDPAWAEIWAKALFLAGPGGIRAAAGNLAALWVDSDGVVESTPAVHPVLAWSRDEVK